MLHAEWIQLFWHYSPEWEEKKDTNTQLVGTRIQLAQTTDSAFWKRENRWQSEAIQVIYHTESFY